MYAFLQAPKGHMVRFFFDHVALVLVWPLMPLMHIGSLLDLHVTSIGSLLDPTSIVYSFLLPFSHTLVNIVNFTWCF